MKSIKCNQISICAKAILRLVFLFCALFAGVGSVWAADYYFNGSGTSNNLNNWKTGNCYGSAATALPTKFDNVYMCDYNGTSLTLTENFECANLIVGKATILNLNGKSLVVNGNLTLYADGGSNPAKINFGTEGSLSVSGNIEMNGSSSLEGTGTLEYGGTLTGAGSNNIPGTIIQNSTGGGEETGGGDDSDDCGTDYDYDPNWCNGIPFENVQVVGTSKIEVNGGGPACFFIKTAGIGNNANIGGNTEWLVNGELVGATWHWDKPEIINNKPTKDGGYYLYYSGSGWVLFASGSAGTPQGTPRICEPTITITTTESESEIALSACAGSAGTAKSFTVSGSALESNVTIELSSGSAYEISTSADGPYSNSITLNSESAATLAATDIYVRIKDGQTAAAEATLTISSENATSKTVSLTGTVNEATLNTIEPITFSTECAGTTLSETITLQGSCFTTAQTITEGENYEISPLVITAEELKNGINVTVTRSGAADSFSDETALIINGVAVKASATVTKPSITVGTLSAGSFGYAECGTPASQNITFTANECAGTVTASLSGGDAEAFTLSQNENTIAVTMNSGYTAGTSKAAEVTLTSTNGATATVTVSGTVTEKEGMNLSFPSTNAIADLTTPTSCGSGCFASLVFSFRGTQNNQNYISIKEDEIQLTSSNTNYSVDYRSDWNNYFGSANGAYNGKTVFVKITKDPSNAKPYTLEFQLANEDNSSPFNCGPSVSPGEIVFDKVCPGDNYAAEEVSFTVSSLEEDKPLVVTKADGYEVTGSLEPDATGKVTVTVTRNTPAGTEDFEDEDAFTISGGGLPADVTVKASGTVSATVITLDINNTPVTFPAICPNGTWARESFEITKLDCPVGETTAAISGDFRIYDAATGGNEVSNLAVGTKYWIEPTNNSTAGKKEGTINVTNNGVSETITVSAEVIDGATLSHTAGEGLEFTTVCANKDFETLSFKVKGVCLSDNITIKAPTGFQVSTNGSTWATELTGISQDTETTIYVKPTISDAGTTASAELTISSGTATELKIPVTAAISEPTISLSMNGRLGDAWKGNGGVGEGVNGAPAAIALDYICWGNEEPTVSICADGSNVDTDAFELSLTEDFESPFTSATTLEADAISGELPQVIYARLKGGLNAKAYSAFVCLTAQGVNTKIEITAESREMEARYIVAGGNWCNDNIWAEGCGDEPKTNWDALNKKAYNGKFDIDVIVCSGNVNMNSCNEDPFTINGKITINNGATLNINASNKVVNMPINVEAGGKLIISGNVTLNNTIDSKGIVEITSDIRIGNNLNLKANQTELETKNITMIGSGFDDAMASIEVIGGDLKIGTLTAAQSITGSGVFKADNINIAQYGNEAGDGRMSVFLKGETEIEKVSGSYKFDDNSIVFSDGNLTFNTKVLAGGDGKKWNITSPTNNNLTFKEGLTINKNPLDINLGSGKLYLPKGVLVQNTGGKDDNIIELTWQAETTYIGGTLDNTNNDTRIHVVGDVQQIDNVNLIAQNKGASWLFHGNFNKPNKEEQNRILCGEDNNKSTAYTLKINANASIINTIWIKEDMYANIVDQSNLGNYAMMAIKGNAYFKAATENAEFLINDSKGLFIDGILVLDGLKINFSNPTGASHVYTPKHEEADLTNHFNELAELLDCICTSNVIHKDEKGTDAKANGGEDDNQYISMCGGHIGENTYKTEHGVEGVGNGKDYSYGLVETPEEGSPAMPCPPSMPNCNAETEDQPFPIELTTFTAERVGAVVELNWATQTETNNDFFSVQRSSNGANFETIAEETGAGTTVIPQHYNHVDYSPLGGTSYYRLKQTDYDGAYSYSPIVPVHFASNGKTFEVLKTSKNNATRLECIFANAAIANQITIHSITGRLEFETEVAPQNNPYVVELPLAPGVYLISNLNIEGKTVVKVMVTN